MEKYPKFQDYEKLYKKYILKRNSFDFLKYLPEEILKNMKVIDLCGGNGRFILEVCELYNPIKSLYIDKEKDMIPFEKLKEKNIEIINEDVLTSSLNLIKRKEKFNVIVCQQAINYWFDENHINNISNLIEKDGYFIFNTFNQKPSIQKTIKKYSIDEDNFTEISYIDQNDMVNHIQIMNNKETHTTKFKWISKEEFLNVLKKKFIIKLIEDSKTSIYICKLL